MDALGMNQLVQMQLVVGISQFYSGVEQMDAHGMHQLVGWQL
jgi:hypothetical protein